MTDKTPLGRVGRPEDIADVIDGGMTLHGSGVDGVLDVVRDMMARR